MSDTCSRLGSAGATRVQTRTGIGKHADPTPPEVGGSALHNRRSGIEKSRAWSATLPPGVPAA